MADELIAKAGSLLMIDEGAYSDYGVVGFFVVLKDFAPMKEMKQYLAENDVETQPYHFNNANFLALLLSKGLLLEIPYATLHLSDYGSAKEIEFRLAGGE